VLAWRNAGPRRDGSAEFYVPYKGHKSAADFKKFYASAQTLFQKEVAKEGLYK
jgi:hypothetical protein